MAQQMVAQTNVLVEGTGKTVEWKKAYKDTGGTWRLAGDAGADDPGTAVTVAFTEGAQSTINAGFYYYYGSIVTSYTYTLYVDAAAQAGLTGVMLFSMDLMPHIALNDTHRASNGSGHADVATNSVHVALVTTNPHAVDTSAANGVDLANVDDTSDATKNAAAVTLTNKTLTTPWIPSIYQDGKTGDGTKLLTIPADTDTLAVNGDMLGDDAFLAKLVDGSVNSNEALSYMSNLMSDSAVVGRIMAEQKRTSYISGTVTPVAAVIPDYVGQEYLDTATNIWYKSVDLLAANWEALN